jgi:hypothetical protein
MSKKKRSKIDWKELLILSIIDLLIGIALIAIEKLLP